MFPTDQIQACIRNLMCKLDEVIPSVATEMGIKKAINKKIDVRQELSWVKCPLHDLSLEIANALIEYSIRKYCKRKE
jgi:hypothetical protein